VKLIRIDPITCVKHYDHSTSCFRKVITKDHYFLGNISNFLFITEFQNHGRKHDHGLLWIKNAPMYKMHKNEKIENFLDMYISCDVSLLPNPLQNAQHQHTHTCKK